MDNFIKERYGEECNLGDKEPSNQDGVYDVSIQCPLGGRTVLKYYPAKNKAISWNLGQDYTFVGDEINEIIYDEEMVDSFRFK